MHSTDFYTVSVIQIQPEGLVAFGRHISPQSILSGTDFVTTRLQSGLETRQVLDTLRKFYYSAWEGKIKQHLSRLSN